MPAILARRVVTSNAETASPEAQEIDENEDQNSIDDDATRIMLIK
jgi:hypothetical protein